MSSGFHQDGTPQDSVVEIMGNAIKTYVKRSTTLGNTWYKVGQITKALYPDGVKLETVADFAKFHILQWKIGKIVRFVNSGDLDSIHDDGVYSFIMESIVRDESSDNIPD